MKRHTALESNVCSLRRVELLFVLGLSMTLLVACKARGGTGPHIIVEDVWSRTTAVLGDGSVESDRIGESNARSTGGTGAVYLKLMNKGSDADRLISANTAVADAVEIHESRMEGDVMKMRRITDGLEIPARSQVLFEPGGYHLMLVGLKQDLKDGNTFSLMLEFKQSDAIRVTVHVRNP